MVTEVQAMTIKSFDVRGSTCPGGGALWALLSHTRDVPKGESIELITDDFLAPRDIPEWGARVGWTVTGEDIPDGYRFAVGRPG